MKTVLFLPVGLGLAHSGRLIMIANELRKKRVNVVFGAGSDAIPLLKREDFQFETIPEFSREIIKNKVNKNNPFFFTRKIIETFVEAELELYKKVKPDLIVFDLRPSARISAEIAGIKKVSICNANFTPYYDFTKIRFPASTFLVKFLSSRMFVLINRKYGQKFLNKVGPKILQAILMIETIRMTPSLIRFGYKLKKDPYQFFLGDITLMTDIPEFRPIKSLPDNVKMIGPVFWNGGSKLPIWKGELDRKDPIVYVSASGTGDKKLFVKILEFLKDSKYTIVATTGNTLKPSEVKLRYSKLYLTDYLPGEFIMKRAKVIIFPGGNASCYQALSYGVPQILTPLHIDQEDNSNQLERLGTGIIINPYNGFNRNNLLEALNKISADNSYKENALKLKKVMGGYNGPETAAKIIKNFIS